MSTPATGRSYKLSALINISLGCVLLLLAAASAVIEVQYPAMRGSGLLWGVLSGAIVCLCVGLFHRRQYRKSLDASSSPRR